MYMHGWMHACMYVRVCTVGLAGMAHNFRHHFLLKLQASNQTSPVLVPSWLESFDLECCKFWAGAWFGFWRFEVGSKRGGLKVQQKALILFWPNVRSTGLDGITPFCLAEVSPVRLPSSRIRSGHAGVCFISASQIKPT